MTVQQHSENEWTAIPKHKIGETVYVPVTERTVEQLDCPDCLGAKEWKVRSPAGGEYSTPCPRCQNTYSLSDNMPSLKIERHVGKVQPRLITGYAVNSRPTEWQSAVEYHSSTGQSSHYTLREGDFYATEEDAQIAADTKARVLNVEADNKPEVLASRRFSSLKLDDARYDMHKNGVWEAHYHAGQLMERVKSALDGESGDEERSNDQIIEDLREAVRWDFKYHIDHLPLAPLVKAATVTDDEAVRDAVAKLPAAMISLLSGKTLADMQPKSDWL